MKNLKINEERNENVVRIKLIDKVRKNKTVIGVCSGIIIAITATVITVSGATTPVVGEDGVIVTTVTETMLTTTSITTTTTTTKVSSSSTTSTTTSLTTSTSKETTETTTTTAESTTEEIITTTEEVIVDDDIPEEDVDEEAAVEVDTYIEDDTTETTSTDEYVVYKPSTCYVHKNTCRWVDSTCYEITSTDGIESHKCSECDPDIEIVSEYVAPTPVVSNSSGLTSLNYITDAERIMLCNVVGGEYGSDWVSLYDKACVVAVVMNRYYDGGWQGSGRENTISNILTAPGQFAGYYANTTYNSNVTQSCKDAVEYYFENQFLFPHYISFWGDGTYNYFK